MRNPLLTLLTIVIGLGILGLAGFAGYQMGLQHSAQLPANSSTTPRVMPGGDPNSHSDLFDRNHPGRFDRGQFRSRQFGNFGRSMGGPGGFFPGLRFLFPLLTLAILLGFAYWLGTRSGWQLVRTSQPAVVTTSPVEPAQPNTPEENIE